jgi:hypothetical protein
MIKNAYDHGVKAALYAYASAGWFEEPAVSPRGRDGAIEQAFTVPGSRGDSSEFTQPAAINATIDGQSPPGSARVYTSGNDGDLDKDAALGSVIRQQVRPPVGAKPTGTPTSSIAQIQAQNPMTTLSANAASANQSGAQTHTSKFVTPAVPQAHPVPGISSTPAPAPGGSARTKAGAYKVPPEKKEEIKGDNDEPVARKNEDRSGAIGSAFNSLNSQGPSDHINSGGEARFGTPGF